MQPNSILSLTPSVSKLCIYGTGLTFAFTLPELRISPMPKLLTPKLKCNNIQLAILLVKTKSQKPHVESMELRG